MSAPPNGHPGLRRPVPVGAAVAGPAPVRRGTLRVRGNAESERPGDRPKETDVYIGLGTLLLIILILIIVL